MDLHREGSITVLDTENLWKIKKKLTFTNMCVEIRRLGSDYHILVSGGEYRMYSSCNPKTIPGWQWEDEQHGLCTECNRT